MRVYVVLIRRPDNSLDCEVFAYLNDAKAFVDQLPADRYSFIQIKGVKS